VVSTNEYDQPIGDDLAGWSPPEPVEPTPLAGRHLRLEPLQRTRHAIPLFHAYRSSDASLWTYMPWGPFVDAAELGQLCDRLTALPDWVPYAVVVDGEPVGMCCYLRMDAPGGVIEIGGIAWAPALQRTTASTEAIVLLITHAFDSGYRRVEWKCDDLNAASRAAAERFGFTYEGTFRKATHYKGRNRDTAWFAIVDDDWPRLQARFATWMDPANFDEDGRQRRRLSEILVGRNRG
jgi:RimJ/RimL family protein N-acetyltransferase